MVQKTKATKAKHRATCLICGRKRMISKLVVHPPIWTGNNRRCHTYSCRVKCNNEGQL